MLGSISFRAFFRFAGFDAEKGHGAPCPFFVWERIGQKQNALSGCTKSIVQEQNDSTTVAPKRLLQLSAAGEVFCTLCRACPQISYHKNGEKLASPERGDSPRGGEMPEGQRGPLSTRWAAKPLGGVLLQNRSIRTPPSLRDTSPFRGGMSFQTLCRDRLCRVRCFCCKEKIVANVPPERLQNHSTAAGTQGGAVLFAPPSKSCRFSHPPAPCAKSMAQGISPSADGDSEGCSPSKNTSPTALSWISLTDSTIPFLFVFPRTFCNLPLFSLAIYAFHIILKANSAFLFVHSYKLLPNLLTN